MHLTEFSIHHFLGATWIVLGLVFLRRAYVGRKSGVLVTLRPSLEGVMLRRDRLMALLLGGSGLLLGIVELFFSRK
jgi:hypothetical protein